MYFGALWEIFYLVCIAEILFCKAQIQLLIYNFRMWASGSVCYWTG